MSEYKYIAVTDDKDVQKAVHELNANIPKGEKTYKIEKYEQIGNNTRVLLRLSY